jgi:hypothetical protein
MRGMGLRSVGVIMTILMMFCFIGLGCRYCNSVGEGR